MSYKQTVDRYFGITRLGSTVKGELLAGIATFISLSYILIVNPTIISQSGIDPAAVLFATVVASSLATIAMGLWAKLPFAVAPGLEMNGFFAFVVCAPTAMALTWPQGLGSVFISGLLGIIFTAIGLRSHLIEAIPESLKTAIGLTVGIFVATIGLSLSGTIVFHSGMIDFPKTTFYSLFKPAALIMFASFAMTVLLLHGKFRVPAAIPVVILASAIACNILKVGTVPQRGVSGNLYSAIAELKFAFNSPHFWAATVIFFIIDFVGGVGKIVGLTASTNIRDEEGNVPNLGSALYIDGIATSVGATLGTSSLIPFVESAVGIKSGGMTGLTAVTCGVLMACSIAVYPLVNSVPPQAVAGILLYVGYLLLPDWKQKPNGVYQNAPDKFVSLVMGAITFITFSLDKALAFGLFVYGLHELRSGRRARAAWLLGLSTVLVSTIVAQLTIVSHR